MSADSVFSTDSVFSHWYTAICWFYSILWHWSMDWESWWALQSLPKMMQVLDVARLMPNPPSLVLSKNTKNWLSFFSCTIDTIGHFNIDHIHLTLLLINVSDSINVTLFTIPRNKIVFYDIEYCCNLWEYEYLVIVHKETSENYV